MATHFYQMKAIAYLSPYQISYTNIVINILNVKECLNTIGNFDSCFSKFLCEGIQHFSPLPTYVDIVVLSESCFHKFISSLDTVLPCLLDLVCSQDSGVRRL